MTHLGVLLSETGKPAEAEAEYRQALAIQQKLADDNPAVTEFRSDLANSHNNLGILLCEHGQAGGGGGRVPQGAGDPAEAGRRQPRRHRIPQPPGGQPQQPRHPAVGRRASRRRRRPSTARRSAIYQKLADDNPAVTEFRSGLAHATTTSAILLSETGKPAEAEAEYRTALAIQQKLADDNPAVTEFRSSLATSHNNLGILLSQTGKPAEAEAEYRKALAIRQKLADDNPAVTEFRSDLAGSHNNLGILLAETGKPAEAEAEYRKALAIRQKLADDNPAVTEFRSRLADSHNDLGILLSSTGKPAEAEAEYRKALAILPEAGRRQPRRHRIPQQPGGQPQQPRHTAVADGQAGGGGGRVPHGRWRSARSWPTTTPPSPNSAAAWRTATTTSASCWRQTGKPAEAEAEYRMALAISAEAGRRQPEGPRLPRRRWPRATATSPSCSAASAARPRPATAASGPSRSARRWSRRTPRSRCTAAHLAESLRRRGLARRDLGDPAGAAADARRALALYDGLPSRSGEEWFETACCHAALAGLAGRAGSGVSAAEAAAEADAAMALLHKAVGMGYRDADAFRTEDALDPLRDRADFRLLMMDLALPGRAVRPGPAGPTGLSPAGAGRPGRLHRRRPLRRHIRQMRTLP